MNPNKFPVRSAFLNIVSVAVIGLSYFQWGKAFPDISQMLFGICFGLIGLYVAYDQWYKTNKDRKYQELVQMQDTFLNWKIKHEEQEKEDEGGEKDGDTEVSEEESGGVASAGKLLVDWDTTGVAYCHFASTL